MTTDPDSSAGTGSEGPWTVQVHGLSVLTELALPGLPTSAGPPAMEIRFGPVSPSLADGVMVGTRLAARPGTFLLEVPGVARYLAEAPGSITIDRDPAGGPEDVRTFLLASVMPGLLHAHGVVPLRASSIQVDGGCVFLVGRPLTGKSTLAAGLLLRGYGVASDDVTALGSLPDGRPVAHPGVRTLRLWEASLDGLEQAGSSPRGEGAAGRLGPGRHGHARRLFHPETPSPPQALPVRGIFLLSPRRWERVSLVPCRGGQRVLELGRCIGAQSLLPWMGDERWAFLALVALSRYTSAFELRHQYRLDNLGELLDVIEGGLSSVRNGANP